MAAPAPSGATDTAGAPAVSGTVKRPNGELYHPRRLSGLPDVTPLQKLRDAGIAALMYGPPGPGRPRSSKAAFGYLVTIQGDRGTTAHRGRIHPNPGRPLRVRPRAGHPHDARGPNPVHRRRDPDPADRARRDLPRDGRPAPDHHQSP